MVDLRHRATSRSRPRDDPHYLAGAVHPASAVRRRRTASRPYRAVRRARFADDPHLWATALFDEVVPLGYTGAYPSFARQLRHAGLRPHCEACAGVKGRETIEIDHPAGAEIQWDWAERRNAPWGAPATACWARSPTRGAHERCSPTRWTSPTSSRPSMAFCDASAAPRGTGAPIASPP